MIKLEKMELHDICDTYVAKLNDQTLNAGLTTKKATIDSCTQYVMQHKQDPSSIMYKIIKQSNESKIMIGTLTLKNINFDTNSCDLGIFVWEPNNGHGTSAINLAKKKVLSMGITKINLGVKTDNTRAIRCYEKCGFKQVSLQMSIELK